MTEQEITAPRDRLIEAGARLMHEKGFTATGVNEICAAAAIKRGSFFHYFPTKRDLALAVLDRQWERAEELVFKPAFATDVPPLDRIKRMFRMSYQFQAARKEEGGCMLGCPFGMMAGEMSAQDEVIRERVERIFAGMASYFTAALSELAEQEQVHIDAPSAGEALAAYLEGALLVAKANNSPAMFARLAELAVPMPVLA